MARGHEHWWSEPPWWAVVVMTASAVALVVMWPIAAGRGVIPPAEVQRLESLAAERQAQWNAEREAAEPPVVAFIGDTYTAGAGAQGSSDRFTAVLAAQQGWREVNLGRGGTGYIEALEGPIAVNGCGTDHCPAYAGLIPDVQAAAPDLVVVAGGRNDLGGHEVSDIADAVLSFYTDLAAVVPGERIIAVSPLWDAGPPPQALAEIAEAVRNAVEGVGGTYLDVGQPLAGHPELVDADGVHPNPEGHRAIAAAISEALAATGLPTTPA